MRKQGSKKTLAFQVSYEHDISLIISLEHTKTWLSISLLAKSDIALFFYFISTLFLRWIGYFNNKHFLECQSHTPTDGLLYSELHLTADPTSRQTTI